MGLEATVFFRLEHVKQSGARYKQATKKKCEPQPLEETSV